MREKSLGKKMKKKTCQTRLLYSAKLLFRTEEDIKTIHCKDKLKEFMITEPALHKMFKDILYTEELKNKPKAPEWMTLIKRAIRKCRLRLNSIYETKKNVRKQ